jgi:hypothetical protein
MPDIEALIRERAYLIWEKSGKPFGRDTDHWFQAAEEIAVESALEPTTLKATAVEMMPPSASKAAPAANPEAGPAPKRGAKPGGKRTLFKQK